MGDFLEIFYDVIFRPQAAMRDIAADRKIGQGAAVFAAGATMPAWVLYLSLNTPQTVKFAYLVVGVHVMGSLILWIGGAAFFHLAAEFLGGRGTAVGLLAALGFSHVPRLVVTPLLVFSSVAAGDYGPALTAAAWVIVLFWTFALDIFAVKGAYGLSGARAVLVLFSPVLLLILVSTIIAIFAGAAVLDFLTFRP